MGLFRENRLFMTENTQIDNVIELQGPEKFEKYLDLGV